MQKIKENIQADHKYEITDAVKIIKKNASAKFDETVDIAVNLGVDPRHADQVVRGVAELPAGTGRKVTVAVFAKGEKAEEAKKAGADIIGDETLAQDIQKGKINFNRCIATPDMMAMVGKLGKILGPRGLMPNPKVGTVTQDINAAVKAAKGGAIEFKVEKNGIVHAGVAKVSFSEEKIEKNLRAFITALSKAKPAGVKGTYIQAISVSTTMGAGIPVEIASVMEQ